MEYLAKITTEQEKRFKKEKKREGLRDEWKFISRVLDRFLFISFGVMASLFNLIILTSSPFTEEFSYCPTFMATCEGLSEQFIVAELRKHVAFSGGGHGDDGGGHGDGGDDGGHGEKGGDGHGEKGGGGHGEKGGDDKGGHGDKGGGHGSKDGDKKEGKADDKKGDTGEDKGGGEGKEKKDGKEEKKAPDPYSTGHLETTDKSFDILPNVSEETKDKVDENNNDNYGLGFGDIGGH